MQIALITSAALLGLAGAPHCAAMCAAPCAAAVGHGGNGWAFHAARLLAYAAAGAVVASAVGSLGTWSAATPVLRPLWTLLQLAALALGVFLLWHGRQPAWMAGIGKAPLTPATNRGGQAVRWAPGGGRGRVAQGVLRSAGFGAAWVAWPCGLLQSALLVAALGSDAQTGALAMACFALASAPGLLLGPWALRRWFLAGAQAGSRERWAARAAGLLLAGASGWALSHGLWEQVAVYCGWR